MGVCCAWCQPVALPLQGSTVRWTAGQGAACPACATTAAPAPTAPTAASAASARRAASRRPSASCPRAPSHRAPSSCSGACASASTSPSPSRECSLSVSLSLPSTAQQRPRFTWPCSGGSCALTSSTLGRSRGCLILSTPLCHWLAPPWGCPGAFGQRALNLHWHQLMPSCSAAASSLPPCQAPMLRS